MHRDGKRDTYFIVRGVNAPDKPIGDASVTVVATHWTAVKTYFQNDRFVRPKPVGSNTDYNVVSDVRIVCVCSPNIMHRHGRISGGGGWGDPPLGLLIKITKLFKVINYDIGV